MKIRLILAVLATAGTMAAQQVKLPVSLDKLAEKAKETVNVTLGPEMLGLASKFLNNKDSGEAEAKKIAGKLRGIYIRSYEFEKEGEYSEADVEEIRSQLKSPEWTPIVTSKSKKETTGIYMHRDGGMLILSAEPKELTVVNIVGPIDAGDLAGLSGQFGIPNVGAKEKPKTKEKKEFDEEF